MQAGGQVGNILESGQVLDDLKETDNPKKIKMETLMDSYPPACLNFNFDDKDLSSDSWSGLFQPDGGSIDMVNAYEYFKEFATG